MEQNLEIEFKNLLTEEEFNRFINFFQLKRSDFFKQINHYFDTEGFELKNLGCALRIREKQNGYEMTLKQPHPQGLLETNESLQKEYADTLLNGGKMTDGAIQKYISDMNIDPENLLYFGSLVTERSELTYKGGLLVLDYSYYLNVKDYEVEYEVTNREEGQSIFMKLLEKLEIPSRKTENKVKRFYNTKQKMK